MSERILHIVDCEGGYQVVTDRQIVTLTIDDQQQCCESWGYFLTEDDPSKFIGAELRGISLTDTNRSARDLERADIEDQGDVLFVDIETDRGVLQFVAYNSHNGYYGHMARVVSNQLEHEVVL